MLEKQACVRQPLGRAELGGAGDGLFGDFKHLKGENLHQIDQNPPKPRATHLDCAVHEPGKVIGHALV